MIKYPHFSVLSCWNLVKMLFLNPILDGGGHYGPDDHKQPRCFYRVGAMATKIHDFVSVHVWMVPWKSFLGFVFKIFEKRKKNFLTILTSKGPLFGKKFQKFQKTFFFKKSYFFFLNLHLHVLRFLLMYMTLMSQKILDFDIFLHENFHFSPWSFDSQPGQNYSS